MDVFFESKPLQQVLPWLAVQMQENLVMSPDIDSVQTLSLKDASWEQVMTAVASQGNLDLSWQEGVAILRAKAALASQQKKECLHSYWTLRHAKAEITGKQLKALYPNVLFIVDHRTNSIVMKSCGAEFGFKSVIEWLDTPLRQVEISAQIAQVSTSAQSQFGVNWQARLSKGVSSTLGGAVELGALIPSTSLSLATSGTAGLLSFTLDMLESEGMAKVISKPKIVTAEGQTAYIESGTEVPYQTAIGDNVNVEFRQATLKLQVTPMVKEGGRILLALTIHQDSVGDLINGVPSLKTNRLQTQVEVNNQETLVLGGIFREEYFESESRVPFFSDIPILGELFKKTLEQQEKVELLVFITPKLLQMTAN
ncbi:type II and III secretion system protein [Marinomonas sp.]